MSMNGLSFALNGENKWIENNTKETWPRGKDVI